MNLLKVLKKKLDLFPNDWDEIWYHYASWSATSSKGYVLEYWIYYSESRNKYKLVAPGDGAYEHPDYKNIVKPLFETLTTKSESK